MRSHARFAREPWVVLFIPADCPHPVNPPLAHICLATDYDDAEAQCQSVFPGCSVVWVYEGSNPDSALVDYWSACNDEEVQAA